jgi:hypothetical protein
MYYKNINKLKNNSIFEEPKLNIWMLNLFFQILYQNLEKYLIISLKIKNLFLLNIKEIN